MGGDSRDGALRAVVLHLGPLHLGITKELKKKKKKKPAWPTPSMGGQLACRDFFFFFKAPRVIPVSPSYRNTISKASETRTKAGWDWVVCPASLLGRPGARASPLSHRHLLRNRAPSPSASAAPFNHLGGGGCHPPDLSSWAVNLKQRGKGGKVAAAVCQ